VNISDCAVHASDDYEIDRCHYTAVQNFMHVGVQTVYMSSAAFRHNQTIRHHAAIFYRVVSGSVLIYTYTYNLYGSPRLCIGN
jgi:hypothetical protein